MLKFLRIFSTTEVRLLIIIVACLLSLTAWRVNFVSGQDQPTLQTPDEKGSRAAFLAAATVFAHPRCVNCHAAGDKPTQNDNSRAHKGSKLQRGADGRGVEPFQCSLCHKEVNRETRPISSPGSPDWRMPPKETPMIFAKRTPAQLCQHLKDTTQNGNRSLAQIVELVKQEPLILWAWSPGKVRAKPLLSHEEFVGKMEEWVNKGAFCPQ